MAVGAIGSNPAFLPHRMMRTDRVPARNSDPIAGGLGITRGADDPSGLIIAGRIRTENALPESIRNKVGRIMDALRVAEGALEKTNGLLTQAGQLTLQAADGAVSDAERGILNTQLQQMISGIDRIANTTRAGDTLLLDGATIQLQTGMDTGDGSDTFQVTLPDATAAGLGLAEANTQTQRDAADAAERVNRAMRSVSEARGNLGSDIRFLEASGMRSAMGIAEAMQSEARIRSLDFATGLVDRVRNQAERRTGILLLGQSSLQNRQILDLLA